VARKQDVMRRRCGKAFESLLTKTGSLIMVKVERKSDGRNLIESLLVEKIDDHDHQNP
jgi:hypothetical protein